MHLPDRQSLRQALTRRDLHTLFAATVAALALPGPAQAAPAGSPTTPGQPKLDPAAFAAARAGFRTQLRMPVDPANRVALVPPRSRAFRSEPYPSDVGMLAGLITPDPKDGQRHPAIIWITGGDSSTVSGETLSDPVPRSNDQNATAYPKAGVVTYFPSLRGGNLNPGRGEGFLGEVDDIIAAARHLATLPYVDPARIYLGGHSTGGTLVMLAAEASPVFRASFAFGPVTSPERYPDGLAPPGLDKASEAERMLRAPWHWLPSVASRLLVIEGEGGNIGELRAMQRINRNPRVTFHEVKGADHFSVLAPINDLIARKILADTQAASGITITAAELQAAFNAR